jgi:hypothetical protein
MKDPFEGLPGPPYWGPMDYPHKSDQQMDDRVSDALRAVSTYKFNPTPVPHKPEKKLHWVWKVLIVLLAIGLVLFCILSML